MSDWDSSQGLAPEASSSPLGRGSAPTLFAAISLREEGDNLREELPSRETDATIRSQSQGCGAGEKRLIAGSRPIVAYHLPRISNRGDDVASYKISDEYPSA